MDTVNKKMEEGGFQLVKRGKRPNNNTIPNPNPNPETTFKFTYQQTKPTKGGEGSSSSSRGITDVPNTIQKIQHVMDDLKKSEFFADAVNMMKTYLLFENLSLGDVTQRTLFPTTEHTQQSQTTTATHFQPLHIKEIVCYGIGNFSFSKKSLHQLCFVLLLSQQLSAAHVQLLLFDPVFTEIEKDVLTKLDCALIMENEEGKRRIQPSPHSVLDSEKVAERKEGVLFYMPHCGKQLYNNLLWANWERDNIDRVVIFGNSFSNYALRDGKSSSNNSIDQLKQSSDKKIRKKNKRKITEGIVSHHQDKKIHDEHQHQVNYIDRISPHTIEINIPQNYILNDIFNDQSLHVFPIQQILDDTFWSFKPEPFSDSCDPEIITKITKICC
eukprot:TRINITY_DN8812_c0_g1_i1.p1 TRINITY_DN8812_c0_g1~~TRINITY_DN8812_c0_g1_i1.p1  ORF type:complete len:384 (-),score=91.09 TRINITY_DN8812_c0_g1_i1:95-1246(-)